MPSRPSRPSSDFSQRARTEPEQAAEAAQDLAGLSLEEGFSLGASEPRNAPGYARQESAGTVVGGSDAELPKQSWYHGELSREQVVKLFALRAPGEPIPDGLWLVRT